MIVFQKINVPAISHGGILIVFQKRFKSFCRDLAGFCPFINREIPGVLALFYTDNDHRMAKSIDASIDFAANRYVWQRMIL